MINAFALVGTDKDLTKLISFLNAGIKRYKEQVMTRAKKKDDAAKGRTLLKPPGVGAKDPDKCSGT